jgi:hypothetical protein
VRRSLDALHSLLGMSGEAGAQALYQQVRRVYVPLLEQAAGPPGGWLPQLQAAGRAHRRSAARLLRRQPVPAPPTLSGMQVSPTSTGDAPPSCSSTTNRPRASGSRWSSATSSRWPPPAAPTRRWRSWASAARIRRAGHRLPHARARRHEAAARGAARHRHVVRLLATAYAEKDVAIAAVNQGKVLRILEKPLDGEATREACAKRWPVPQRRRWSAWSTRAGWPRCARRSASWPTN